MQPFYDVHPERLGVKRFLLRAKNLHVPSQLLRWFIGFDLFKRWMCVVPHIKHIHIITYLNR